jgi:hypothetical protein
MGRHHGWGMAPSHPFPTDRKSDANDAAQRVDQLLDEVVAAGEFPASLLLRALALVGSLAAGSAARPWVADQILPELSALHLELAAVEITEATGLSLAGPVEDSYGSRPDVATRVAAGRLLDHCISRIHDRLDCGGGDLDGEQLLGLTRAVLHLQAARRTWNAADTSGPVP